MCLFKCCACKTTKLNLVLLDAKIKDYDLNYKDIITIQRILEKSKKKITN